MGSTGLEGALMNPTGTASSLTSTMSDPQKMLAGFVGPEKAGIKPPPPQPAQLKTPGTAMKPKSYGELQELSIGAGGGGGLDPDLMKMLQSLASR